MNSSLAILHLDFPAFIHSVELVRQIDHFRIFKEPFHFRIVDRLSGSQRMIEKLTENALVNFHIQ